MRVVSVRFVGLLSEEQPQAWSRACIVGCLCVSVCLGRVETWRYVSFTIVLHLIVTNIIFRLIVCFRNGRLEYVSLCFNTCHPNESIDALLS